MPYDMSIASAASPMVDALLVGPEEFERTVIANEKSFGDYRVVKSFEAVVGGVFFKGCTDGGRRSVMGTHQWKFGTSNPSKYGEEAKDFAHLVGRMRSAHYALGRSALQARIGNRPESVQDPKEILSDKGWEALWERRINQQISRGNGPNPMLKDGDIQARMLQSLRIEMSENDLPNIRVKLEAIWSNAESKVADRKLALQLWYAIGENTAGWLIVDFQSRIHDLLEVVLRAPQEVADVAFEILGYGLARKEAREIALNFLATLEDKLRNLTEEQIPKADKLLNLYRNILGVHGKQVTQSDRIQDGALALFDIARVTTLSKEDRETAVRDAIDLAHGLLPYGAQAAYAWALWQVEESSDPYMAYHIAWTYSFAFTVRDLSFGLSTISPQDTILRAALKREDLSEDQRRDLWDRYRDHHFFWTRWWRSGQRRWGTLGNRELSPVAIQKA